MGQNAYNFVNVSQCIFRVYILYERDYSNIILDYES